MFLGALQVKLFYFTPFGRKRLQTAPEAAGEALPNGALVFPSFYTSRSLDVEDNLILLFYKFLDTSIFLTEYIGIGISCL